MSNLNLMVGDWVIRLCRENIKVTPDYLLYIANYPDRSPKPIELTPEILDKIEGMEQREFKDGYVLCDIKIHDDVDKYWVSIDRKILHIPHLHTLQQLIRLFTGKEIVVKWEK